MSGTKSSLLFTVIDCERKDKDGGGGEGQGKASLTSQLLATLAIPPTVRSVVTQRGAEIPLVPDQGTLAENSQSQDVIKEMIK